MGTGADERDLVTHDQVDQEPVRLDVALPEVLLITAQLVVAKPVLQRLLVGEMAHHGVQLVEVLTSATRPLPVPLERAGKARAKRG
jgi:hypothetical protein